MMHRMIRNCYYKEVGYIWFWFGLYLKNAACNQHLIFPHKRKRKRLFFLSLKCLLMWLEVVVHLNYGNTLKGGKLHPLHPLSFFILSLELYLVSSIQCIFELGEFLNSMDFYGHLSMERWMFFKRQPNKYP